MLRYTQNHGPNPRQNTDAPITNIAKAMVCILFLKPPQKVIANPPIIIPIEKAISMAVSIQTSSPYVRATWRGVSKAPGAIKKKKTAQNIKKFLR